MNVLSNIAAQGLPPDQQTWSLHVNHLIRRRHDAETAAETEMKFDEILARHLQRYFVAIGHVADHDEQIAGKAQEFPIALPFIPRDVEARPGHFEVGAFQSEDI